MVVSCPGQEGVGCKGLPLSGKHVTAVLQREKPQNSASENVADLQHSDLKRVNSKYALTTSMCSTTPELEVTTVLHVVCRDLITCVHLILCSKGHPSSSSIRRTMNIVVQYTCYFTLPVTSLCVVLVLLI